MELSALISDVKYYFLSCRAVNLFHGKIKIFSPTLRKRSTPFRHTASVLRKSAMRRSTLNRKNLIDEQYSSQPSRDYRARSGCKLNPRSSDGLRPSITSKAP